MNRFIHELHRKPEVHRKRIALWTSVGVTLLIFGIWSLVTFGLSSESATVASDNSQEHQASILNSLKTGTAAAIQSITGSARDDKAVLEPVTDYER